MHTKLGVNIDHIATLREARKINYPDPIFAAAIAEQAGACSITVHLREDRRHIQDRDIYILKDTLKTSMNLEMALAPDVIDIACDVKPKEVCIVPEKRQEITTEGGLDLISNKAKLLDAIPRLHEHNIIVSLFIDPDNKQIEMAKEVGADYIELHTGQYANAKTDDDTLDEFIKIKEASEFAVSIGLRVNAGHGLNYQNTTLIASIPQIEVLNIGHSIISRAVFTGLERAVRDMIELLNK